MPSYKFGPFTIDSETRVLSRDGEPIQTTAKSFDTILALIQNRGRLMLKEELLSQIWPGHVVEEANLTQSIFTARKLLGDNAKQQQFISTISGRGYQFVAPVTELQTTADNAAPPSRMWPPSRRIRKHVGYLCAISFACVLAYAVFKSDPSPGVTDFVQLTHDGQPKSLVGTDGSRLYLQMGDSLAQIPVGGGEAETIPSSRNKTAFGISADGSAVLGNTSFSAPSVDTQLWRIPLPSGAPLPLGNAVGHDAAWSADGRALVYAHEADLIFANGDGSQRAKDVSLRGLPRHLSWASDGLRVRFDLLDPETGSGSLWEISAPAYHAKPLLQGNHPPDACCGTPTPDGKYFVFESRGQIWALPDRSPLHAATNPIELTSSPMALTSPLISRDGRKLFVVGKVLRGELVRFDSKPSKLTKFLGGISAEFLAFSKDKQWVAYVTFPDGILWRSRLDGTERLPLTSPPLHPVTPSWSPAGTQIVFTDNAQGRPTLMYSISANGAGLHAIMPQGPLTQIDPSWSPDGKQLLFGSSSDDPHPSIRTLTIQTGVITDVPESNGLFSPRWSPDGRYIAALSLDCRRLVLFDCDRKNWTDLAKSNFNSPAWSKDGNYLYVVSPLARKVVRLRMRDRVFEDVVSAPTDFRSTGLWRFWIGYGPDDSILGLRDTGLQEAYSLTWHSRR